MHDVEQPKTRLSRLQEDVMKSVQPQANQFQVVATDRLQPTPGRAIKPRAHFRATEGRPRPARNAPYIPRHLTKSLSRFLELGGKYDGRADQSTTQNLQ